MKTSPEMRPELNSSFRKQYLRLRKGEVPRARIEFYPYTRLSNTIRERDGRILIRISDILQDAPPEVLESLFTILLHKIYSKPVPAAERKLYNRYVNNAALRAKIRETRRSRGRKQFLKANGKVFNLREIFEQLNDTHFGGELTATRVGWSRKSSRKTLGHFDGAHNTITINRRLDNPLVPEYVVTYVMYHEMLHAHLGERIVNGRRRVHDREFRKRECLYPQYEKANRFIEQYFIS